MSADAFRRYFQQDCYGAVFSPGRINLIGEHIDYCGGCVLPMAINRGTRCYFAPNDAGCLRVYSERFDEMVTVPLAEPPARRRHWVDFVSGVLVQFQGDIETGIDIYVTDDIASGGLSSSASFTTAIALVLMSVAGMKFEGERDRFLLARACQRAENEFVGVPCGLMDQASVALGGILRLDCASMTYEQVPADLANCSLVVMDTRQPRTLAASRYGERVSEIAEICEQIGLAPATLCRDFDAGELEEACFRLPPPLAARLRHVVTEQLRVRAAAEAVASSNLAVLGLLMNESHVSLRDHYEVTGRALDTIVDASRAQPGVLGARMTGAGFGGCAIALVKTDAVEFHNEAVTHRYRDLIGVEPTLFSVSVDPGLRYLSG